MKIHAFKILKNENKKEGGKGAPSILKKKKTTQKTISWDTIKSNKGTNSSLKIGTYANFKH